MPFEVVDLPKLAIVLGELCLLGAKLEAYRVLDTAPHAASIRSGIVENKFTAAIAARRAMTFPEIIDSIEEMSLED